MMLLRDDQLLYRYLEMDHLYEYLLKAQIKESYYRHPWSPIICILIKLLNLDI